MSEPQKDEFPVIVGIRFSKIGKNYYFDATKINDIKIGDYLVVETSRGWQLGELAEIVSDPRVLKNANYKKVDRLATPVDLVKREELNQKAEEALEVCNETMKNQRISDVKVVTAEFSFDEKIISFLFSCEADEVPNLKNVKKAIGKKYPNTRIDFHKIGPRDVAKFLGGMGACGFPTRCCAKFLGKFESISIRMAKTQGISLTPSDITGMCDRLRCCLSYEHCQYVEALKNMPKRNRMVMTPNGQGKIKDIAPLRECVYVKLDEVGLKEFHVSQIEEMKQPKDNKQQHGSKNQSGRRNKPGGRRSNNKRSNQGNHNNQNNDRQNNSRQNNNQQKREK
jgi:cell fate regulator YaaT (PSP1 superfamily)